MKLKVKNHKKINSNTYQLIYEKPINFFFYPGQYLDISLPIEDQDKRGQIRGFTIGASPTEDFLMTTYRQGISDFKTHFVNLKPGDEIEVSHPSGTFILDETEGAAFLAGGIGITPFRCMIKYALDKNLKIPITLIFSNPNDEFVFKEELDKWQKEYPKLKVFYVNTSRDGRIDAKKLTTNYQLPTTNTTYYLAGPLEMVQNYSKALKMAGIDKINIRIDPFDGY